MSPQKRSASPLDLPGVKRHRGDPVADGQIEADSVAVVDSDSRASTGRDTPEPGRVEPQTQHPVWAPLSHKPLYPGEPGYETYKSRVVFKAEPVPSNLRYCNTSFGQTVSALDKFLLWRKKQVNKLNDGGVRSAPRIIILDEGELCMPLHDLDKYTTTLWRAGGTNLGKTLSLGMPNSFVVIRICCPANIETGNGRFRACIEALSNLLEEYPHNFSVEVENQAIREVESPNEEHELLMRFIDALEVFYETGSLPNRETKPFRYREKKHRVGQEYDEDGNLVNHLEREVQAAVKFLPWISEDYARQFYTKVLQGPDYTGSLEQDQTCENPTGLMPQENIRPAVSLERAS